MRNGAISWWSDDSNFRSGLYCVMGQLACPPMSMQVTQRSHFSAHTSSMGSCGPHSERETADTSLLWGRAGNTRSARASRAPFHAGKAHLAILIRLMAQDAVWSASTGGPVA